MRTGPTLGEYDFNTVDDFNQWSEDQARLFHSFIRPVTVIERDDGTLYIYYTEETV